MGKLNDFLHRSSSHASQEQSQSTGSEPHTQPSLYSADDDTDKDSKSDSDDDKASAPLIPLDLPGPVGLFPAYIVQGKSVTLAVRSDSAMSTKKWTITDATTGDLMFRATGKDATMRVEKVITDADGREICILRRHNVILQGGYYVEALSGSTILEFKRHRKVLAASFTDQTGQSRTLQIEANWRKCRGVITLDGMYLSSIAKEEGTSLMAMNSTYNLSVPKGMDLALMSIVAIVFVNIAKEYNQGQMAAIM